MAVLMATTGIHRLGGCRKQEGKMLLEVEVTSSLRWFYSIKPVL